MLWASWQSTWGGVGGALEGASGTRGEGHVGLFYCHCMWKRPILSENISRPIDMSGFNHLASLSAMPGRLVWHSRHHAGWETHHSIHSSPDESLVWQTSVWLLHFSLTSHICISRVWLTPTFLTVCRSVGLSLSVMVNLSPRPTPPCLSFLHYLSLSLSACQWYQVTCVSRPSNICWNFFTGFPVKSCIKCSSKDTDDKDKDGSGNVGLKILY